MVRAVRDGGVGGLGRSMVLRAPRASVAPRMSHTFIALRLTPRERATPWQIVGGRFPDLRASFRVVIPGKTVAGRCARRASRSALCCVGIFHTTRAASAPPLLTVLLLCVRSRDGLFVSLASVSRRFELERLDRARCRRVLACVACIVHHACCGRVASRPICMTGSYPPWLNHSTRPQVTA